MSEVQLDGKEKEDFDSLHKKLFPDDGTDSYQGRDVHGERAMRLPVSQKGSRKANKR